MRLYDASLGTGLFAEQLSGSPFPFVLQVTEPTISSYFPLELNPLGGKVSTKNNTLDDGSSGAATFASRVYSTYNNTGAGGGFTAAPTTNTNAALFEAANNSNTSYFGNEASVGGSLFTGTSAYATVIGNNTANPIQFFTNNAKATVIDTSQGLTQTGTITAGGPTGVSRFVGNINNSSGSIASGATWTPVISAANGSGGLFIIGDDTQGTSAVIYYSYSNGLTIISQNTSEFAITASPTSSQTGLQFVSSTGVLTVKNGFAAAKGYNITVIGQ
jgi:hypothetical protein